MSERHSHYCKGCNVAWAHDGDDTQELSPSEYKRAHSCPDCGEVRRWRLPANFQPSLDSHKVAPYNDAPYSDDDEPSAADILQMMMAAFLLKRLTERKRKESR